MRHALFLTFALVAAPAFAQTPHAPAKLTADDYARAERFLPQNVNPLVYRGAVRPNWLDDDRFWYRNAIPEGAEYVLVDPARRTRARAFDHERLAAALSAATGKTLEPLRLEIR